jgi:ribosome biogenesis protein YTM1
MERQSQLAFKLTNFGSTGENESNSISSQYTSHTGWVSAVRWHPTNSQLLLSASYDNSLKLWDIRSKSPLHTLPNQHSDKIMCLEWVDDYTFVSGGADSTLKFYTFSGATVSRK